MSPRLRLLACAAALSLATASAASTDAPTFGAQLEGFDYAYEVRRFELTSQGQTLSMAYVDQAPRGRPNGRTVVLLHGKNFCAATWEQTINELTRRGYRVVAPDQVGFCKSSKPAGYQFSLDQLASNTHALLASLEVERAVVVGHSMGGMLAARFALNHPKQVEQLVLVNPIGLEDWRAKGVPYATIDTLLEQELRTSYESIKAYQLKYYYSGVWQPRYDRWVRMLAGMYAGPGGRIVARNQAQTSEMIYTQPVVHEFDRIVAPTLLLIGQKDRTAPGANRAAPDVAKRLGDYRALGRNAADRIPNATLVEFAELGHSPQVESPKQFHEALLRGIERGTQAK